jgi:multiple sugar transport system substrate-binding protein
MKRYIKTVIFITALLVSANLSGCKKEIKANGRTAPQTEESSSLSSESSATDSSSNDMQTDIESHSDEPLSASDTEEQKTANMEELVFLGDIDITADSDERALYGIDLYENAGGKIRYEQCVKSELYDKLAESELAKNQIDAALYDNGMAYPYACMNSIFQPIDGLVDFDSELWQGVKSAADKFELNGWHYTAPAAVIPASLFYYSKSVVGQFGFDDPYELYSEGKWNWNAWENMVRTYSDKSSGRYGIGGDYGRAVFLSTGKTLIGFEKSTESFVTNIFDADLANAADLLYGLKNDGICYDGMASTNDCTGGTLLFYAAGGSLADSLPGDISSVPPPSFSEDGKTKMQADITAFMWVNGSDKPEEFKLLLECSRKAGIERMAEFPYFSADSAVYDFSGGISDRLSDAGQNENFGAGVIPFMYSAPSEYGEWDSICGYFSNAITVELSILNNKYVKETY